jgi:hypothetical protein
MELFGLITAASVVVQVIVWSVAGLLLPAFWLWMLIDAVIREEWEYPGSTATSNNKLVWVLLIVLVNIMVVPYFFMVHAKIKRGTVARPAWAAVPVVAQVPAPQV